MKQRNGAPPSSPLPRPLPSAVHQVGYTDIRGGANMRKIELLFREMMLEDARTMPEDWRQTPGASPERNSMITPEASPTGSTPEQPSTMTTPTASPEQQHLAKQLLQNATPLKTKRAAVTSTKCTDGARMSHTTRQLSQPSAMRCIL